MSRAHDDQGNDDGRQEAIPLYLLPLVGGFLERRSAEIPLLRAAIGENDFATIKLLGHRLKGNGAGFGFPLLSRLGAELEASASANDKAEALRLTEDLAKLVCRLLKDMAVE